MKDVGGFTPISLGFFAFLLQGQVLGKERCLEMEDLV